MTADGKSRLKALPSKIFVLAAVYFIVGMLTLAANIPLVIDTVVWLPAGISLTAILVWGYRVWPGIMLGAFAAQAAVHLDLTSGGTPFMTLVISALIGLGAVLQGFVGAYLILRFGGFPRSLNRLREADILLFGGPVGCLVGARFGWRKDAGSLCTCDCL
jgi:integral membrane sensor domain MASE1